MNRIEDLLQFVRVLAAVDEKMSAGGDGNFWEARKEYIATQAHRDFRIGDRVRVLRRPEIDSLRVWGGNWCRQHEDSIGREGNVAAITPFGIHVSFKDQEACFPCYVLYNIDARQRAAKQQPAPTDAPDAPAKEGQHPFKPFDKVLVRNASHYTPWQAAIFSHMRDSEESPYMACGVAWELCIPYEGNEYLLGTTNSPDGKYEKRDR